MPRFLICASSSGRISLFHMKDIVKENSAAPQPALSFQAHKGAAYTLTFHGQGEDLLLLSGGDDGRILGWRWDELEQAVDASTLKRGGQKATPDAVPSPSFELQAPQVVGPYNTLLPVSEVNSLAATASPGAVLSGGGDGVCYLWDLAAQRPVTSMKVRRGNATDDLNEGEEG
ncbi:hypothetical protein CYMTET_43820, partial [Cymbomonas tetramitiformis]